MKRDNSFISNPSITQLFCECYLKAVGFVFYHSVCVESSFPFDSFTITSQTLIQYILENSILCIAEKSSWCKISSIGLFVCICECVNFYAFRMQTTVS